MSNEEILRKAIEKAVKNGWCFYEDGDWVNTEHHEQFLFWITDYVNTKSPEAFRIIFRHDFAKAFFGENPDNIEARWEMIKKGGFTGFDNFNPDTLYSRRVPMNIWQYHLQQMVLSPDPIQYLAKYL